MLFWDWPLVNRPDSVLVWSSQLRNNDFPPVCAMSGRPAETWRKFQFTTAPGWAYLFLILICIGIGLLLIFVVMFAVSRRASGYLPLTHESSRSVARASSAGLALFLLVAVLWVLGIAVGVVAGDDSAASTVSGILFALGLLALVVATAYWLLVKPRFGPQGKVMAKRPGEWDNLVELRHVHPAFVAAVQQHQQWRASQAIPPPPPPAPPSSLLPS